MTLNEETLKNTKINIPTILLVDDDPNQVQLVKIYLKDEKLNFLTAINGRHALATLVKENIDLILTDNQMPEMDGETMIVKIREELKLDIPIYILSANETNSEITNMKNVFALNKPFTSEQIKSIIKEKL